MQDRTRGGTLPVARRAAFGSYGCLGPEADRASKPPPGDACAAQAGAPRAEASQAGVSQAGAPRAETSQAGASQAGAPRAETSRAGASQAGPSRDEASARPDGERRHPPDRRCGLDRRDSGWQPPLQAEPRAYGFRDFRPRRATQDRRLFVEACGTWDSFARRRRDPTASREDGVVTLTPEEIEMLLAETDE